MNRPRILLIAEACNPQWVSVPLVGWSLYQALARQAQVHLVTQVRNRQALLEAGLTEGSDFTAINSERLAAPVYRLGEKIAGGAGKGWTIRTAANALSYPYFEWLAWRQFSARLRQDEFDVVHRITPLSPALPSLLARRCRRLGVPFVIGPLNGGVPWPKGFDATRRKEKEWLSYVRSAYKLLPGYRSTRRDASAILVASRVTWEQISPTWRHKCYYLPENAIDPTRFCRRRTRKAQRPLRLIYIGRLVPLKGVDMLIQAAAPLMARGDLVLQIIGDGPELPELRRLAEQTQVSHAIDFAGWVEHAKLQDHLAEADLFTFPSIREFGGAVILEAMAVGVPSLVLAYGGPQELVTPQTGFLIPMGPRAQIIQQLHDTLAQLAQNPEPIDAKAPAALARAHGPFTWDAKAAQIVDIYRRLIDSPHPPRWDQLSNPQQPREWVADERPNVDGPLPLNPAQ